MNKSDIIHALGFCENSQCAICPFEDTTDCVLELMRCAKTELEKSEENDMPKGRADFDKEREKLIAEREKLVTEINYQRQHLDEVLQENKLLQAQMHVVHMIFGRRNGNYE